MSKVEMKIQPHNIRDIFQFLDERRFAIPKLQRDFVWNNKKVCNLTDSIYKNLPIGTILIWETKRANSNLLKKSLTALPPYDDSNKNVWFILDGQQRISVLHSLRKGSAIKNSKGKMVDFDKMYFSVDVNEHGNFLPTKRHDPKKHILVSDIISHNWKKMVKRHKTAKNKYSRIKKCRDSIMNYKIPFVFFQSKEIDAAREVFIRINALGTPLKTADRVFSRAAEIDLRYLTNEARIDWKHGFSNLPDNILQQVLSFDLGKVEVGEKAIDNAIGKLITRINEGKVSTKAFVKRWEKIKHAIGLSIDHLKKYHYVADYSILPSTTMVATLAMFFIYNKLRLPNDKQHKLLRQWFWTTAVAQRYSGKGYRDNILSDVHFFENLAKNKVRRFVFKEKVPEARILLADYSTGSALTKAFYCLLISKEPRYLDSPAPIPTDAVCSSLNKKQKHHIFPQKLMRTEGFTPKEYNRVSNICFIVAKENPAIGKAKPHEYLQALDGRRRKAFLTSHILPIKKDSALWTSNVKKDYKSFLKERTKLICKEIEGQAGLKIFTTE